MAAGAVGVAQAAFDAAVGYATERTQFVGKPIAADAGVGPKDYGADASVAKYHAAETVVQVSNKSLQTFGGYGNNIDEYPVGKYLRDARVLTLYEGTSQVQKLLIGRHLTGIDAVQ